MNLRSTLCLPVLAILLLATDACKKTAEIDPSTCRLASVGSNRADYSFSYSSSGQLLKTSFQTYAEEFTYSSSQITSKITPVPGTGSFVGATYLLNTAGYITKMTQSFKNSSTIRNTLYGYDTDGHLIREDSYDGTFQLYEWTNGNLTKTRGYSSLGKLQFTSTYTYYEDKQLVSPTRADGVFGDEGLYTLGLLGKPSKNPVKQEIALPPYGYTADYRYTYAGNGTISSQTSEIDGIPQGEYTYTYLCQ